MIGRSLELIGCPYPRRQPRHEQFWPAQMPLHFMPMNMYVMASNCQEILYVDSLSISSASQYTPSDCIRRAKVVSPCQGFCIKVKGFKSGITRQLKFFHAFKCTDFSFSPFHRLQQNLRLCIWRSPVPQVRACSLFSIL
jgi:hypothetical protein